MKDKIKIGIFLAVLIFSSCSREKPTGHWKIAYSSMTSEYPSILNFTEDSITLKHPYFNINQSYKLNFEHRKYHFNDISWKIKVDADSLVINNEIKYFKSEVESQATELKLPNYTNDSLFQEKFMDEGSMLMAYQFLGDDSKPLLRINETFIDLSDLQSVIYEFMSGGFHRPRLNIFLFIDRNIKMRDIEKLFLEIAESNILKIHLVNDVKFTGYIDSFEGVPNLWQYKVLSQNMMPIFIDEKYFQKINNVDFTLPPSPPLPEINLHQDEILKLVLEDEDYYIEDKVISKEDLISIVNIAIENKKKIFSIYSLESSYSTFLEFNAIIRSAYRNKREALSQEIFGRSFDDLDNSKKRKIKEQVPIFHFWQFSKDYYEEVIVNPDRKSDIKVLISKIPKTVN